MTLAISWIRKISDGSEELIFASDSRLSGGRNLDCCPKILTLARSDSAMAFAGDTDFSFPLIHQLKLAIESHQPSLDRAMDLHKMKAHALKVFNSMSDSVQSYVEVLENPDTSFLLGGYSWVNKEFAIWKIHYKEKEKRFACRPAKTWIEDFGKIAFIGDRAKDAQNNLIKLLKEKYGLTTENGASKKGFDMEPFEVLRNMLRKADPNDSIGGAPQLVKVYQHMNCRSVGVYWPNKSSKNVYLLGRPLFDYENTDNWIMDPDKLITSHPRFSKNT
ncbi:hypothetical protein [Fodinibius sediminis]|uniref:Uncharacterized protein n=1 Tax=Fodinibius sediminis TaxID=1214077 RepID=A0A521F8M8_9BACT|nr:hypothetical protein [Fodinibius sediminis]SMO92562.1 hypothetical protein SAMN06265218_12623 [Fodinibius sediminis]